MPFAETHVVDERTRFIEDAHRSLRSFAQLCERYGISRTTGYKWLERWKAHGPPGLEDQSTRPNSCPWATSPEVVEAILKVRRTYDDYGAKKIRWYLETHRPELSLPSRTTIHNILLRHDLVPKRRKRLRRWHPGRPHTSAETSNATWSADFKGEFPTRDGRLCYPLTVQDMYSRFLLACRGLPDVTIDGVIPVFTRLFREFGLPDRIRTDNGTPFASNALGRLSTLSVWFVQLRILPEFIEPGCPQQNGKHENMHLVLKRRTTRPPRSTMRTQQRAFRDFIAEYNHIRPHEALDGAVPSDLYRPSPRVFPKTLAPITYPGHFETRLVSTNGGIRWYADRIPVSRLLAGHNVGLEEIDHGLFDVYFGPIWLGRFIEPKRLIVDSLGRGKRTTGGTYKGRRTVKQVS
jgi:transposase InsO family protein